MYSRLDRAHRAMPVVLGSATLLSVGALIAWDVNPAIFPAKAHDILAAIPLVLIAISYLVYQTAHRPPAKEFAKAMLLAIAFLFWAANQMWPDLPQATLFWSLLAGQQVHQTNRSVKFTGRKTAAAYKAH